MQKPRFLDLAGLIRVLSCLLVATAFALKGADPLSVYVQAPQLGDHELRILSPTLIELYLVNTKDPDPARVDSWDWVDDQQGFIPPDLSQIHVRANGSPVGILEAGFRRRPVYAPLAMRDLRLGNSLFLELAAPLPSGASVVVTNTGVLWRADLTFAASVAPLRINPAIHVNQEGYLPGYPKRAMVGYSLGDLGEMSVPTNRFLIVDAQTHATNFQGTLVLRPDVGYLYSPTPYQKVYEADFTSFTTPGKYLLVVPGMGASLPFRIDEGTAMAFARTYALGMLHQRSGMAVEMPFTRFTHGADHITPALVPTNASAPFAFTWETVANYALDVNPDNPAQIAPALTNFNAQLFPFVNQGAVQVSGGHFEAGDYNRVTYNGAQIIHTLVFAADSLTGAGTLDNLGIPESGDGISDLLQEAKWEADFLERMQDADGGFYYSVYPQNREYEIDVLPENGDPQVIWPKNTASAAAAVAALAQCASSPRFKQAYPAVAASYLTKARLGWQFLTNAIARLGFDGAYQRVQHFDDYFTHRDDLAWAACELYLATGDPQYQAKLFEWYPDPTDPATFRFVAERMFAAYGNVIRSYAFGVRSGRVGPGLLQSGYLGACLNVITNHANDLLAWSQESAYGTSLPILTKAYRGGGWYFSTAHTFDLAVAYEISPRPEYLDAFIQNLNFEAGANPVNVSYVTGLGWKRLHNVVDQYSLNDRRVLPKDGIPVSNVQSGFSPTWFYGWELGGLAYPFDYADSNPYPYYDRWSDDWNVSTEGSTTDMARSCAGLSWLAARTALAGQTWRSTTASINAPSGPRLPGQPLSVTLTFPATNPVPTRIIWEAQGQEPIYGDQAYTFTSGPDAGAYWIEAEVQWPDGRRAFAQSSVSISPDAGFQLGAPRKTTGGSFSFTLAGPPSASYVVEVSSNLVNWTGLLTNALPVSGQTTVSDSPAGSISPRFYRVRSGS